MNQTAFQQQYEQAILKVAIGFYIIEDVGNQLNYKWKVIDQNKRDLCNILSQGIGITTETILEDANIINRQLPFEYIQELRRSGLLEELRREMSQLNLEILT